MNRAYKIIDVCCGARMLWFDRENYDTVYIDKRKESLELKNKSSKGGMRILQIKPTIQADYQDLPFRDSTFYLVVFDPPHLIRSGQNGWIAKTYGKLCLGWEKEIQRGFHECFRVLHPNGTLIFKWSESDIKVSKILSLIKDRPILGSHQGKQTIWLVFRKGNHVQEKSGLFGLEDIRQSGREVQG